MLIHGRCHCGEISYDAEVEPGTIAVCHCDDCQTFAGAPYRAMIGPKAGSLKVHGTPRTFTKTAESGRQRVQTFCGTCATHLWACDPAPDMGRIGLRIGAIAERHQLGAPARQLWCDSALEWSYDLTNLPKVTGQG